MWRICLKCWNMTEGIFQPKSLGLEDNWSQYCFKICFYIYRYSIHWDKTEAKSLEFWRITFPSVLLSLYSWSILLHHCFLYIGPYEIQVCVQLLKTHEQLLSAHCKQVCFLSPPPSPEVKLIFSMASPLLAIPGCESSAWSSFLLSSTRNCHRFTRQPNYTNQSNKIILKVGSGKVITHKDIRHLKIQGKKKKSIYKNKLKKILIKQNMLEPYLSDDFISWGSQI